MDANILRTYQAVANLDKARETTRAKDESSLKLEAVVNEVVGPEAAQNADVQAAIASLPWYCKERGFATHERMKDLGDCWNAVVDRTVTQEQANFLFFLVQEAIQENLILRQKIDMIVLNQLKRHIQQSNWGRYGRQG